MTRRARIAGPAGRVAGVATAMALLAAPPPAAAQEQPRPEEADSVPVYVLEPVVVEGRIDDLVGTAATASMGYVGRRDLALRPLLREGELLETVPGMILTQHSGDGKSNQMFVRGFNLDHGTDFLTLVDGMPVNIPTHAHGQGYTDLNFIIPELVDHVEYRLGGYYADVGDFGSAGSAHLRLRRDLERPLLRTELGEGAYRRVVAAGALETGAGTLLAGAEVKGYDGPWDVAQDLRKLSGVVRHTWRSGNDVVTLTGLGYTNRWSATDQIPRRAVESGLITRLAPVDSTLGGETSRWSLSGAWTRTTASSSRRVDAYAIRYDLDLYSNFTYFLDDPASGDQIRQRDRGRWTVGAALVDRRSIGRAARGHELTTGVQLRGDLADVTLARARERSVTSVVRSDEVAQWSAGGFVQLVTPWTPSLRTIAGLRGDVYRYDVTSDLAANTGTAAAGIVSPKLSAVWAAGERTELYASVGLGFHGNDARGTVMNVDPASGDAVEPVDPLVRSRGAEIGLRASPVAGLRTTIALWTVGLDSELVFVGDAGTTEAGDASRRVGLTVATYYGLRSGLSADLDVSLARARFLDVPAGEDRIPGAMENVIAGGLTWEPRAEGPFATLRLRRFGAYPLLEDDAVRAGSTSLLNLGVGYTLRGVRLALSVLNLLDAEGSDIEYYYPSRLPGEVGSGVDDVHFHPIEPRQLRIALTIGG